MHRVGTGGSPLWVGLCSRLGFSPFSWGAPLPVPMVANYVQLTHDGLRKNLIGTDGSRLYLATGILGSRNNNVVTQMSISGGEPVRIPGASNTLVPLNVSQDGAKLLVKDNQGGRLKGKLWSLPVLEGSPRPLGGIAGQDAAWSPDGGMLVYADESDLLLPKGDGTEPRKLVSVTGRGLYPVWSPDGSRVRFTVEDYKTEGTSLWEVSAQGTNLHRCFPDGIILQTNAAGNGRRTENTTSSDRRGRSGHSPKRERSFAKPRANLSS